MSEVIKYRVTLEDGRKFVTTASTADAAGRKVERSTGGKIVSVTRV